ncbi:MAG TPA: outer membrane beta-barrel protein [Methylomirabilota bacterium]|nr:outer membrane beta-barrel protein [Methylomirabilota bacterium]
MILNKWTVGLAAAGLVSLPSGARADEQPSSIQTALSSTTLSGSVDVSAVWNPGTGNANQPRYKYGGAGKSDGFNLNAVNLTLEKPLDEQQWAAGYRVDLMLGPDANTFGSSSVVGGNNSDFAIRQAYVAMRAPWGNGLDIKVGVFDAIIGYEGTEAGKNPNYTRSYGHTLEPSTHTGVLLAYQVSEMMTLQAGIANTVGPASINYRSTSGSVGNGLFPPGSNAKAESYKAYMASIALSAPDSFGFLAGSTLYAGVVNGFNGSVAGTGTGLNETHWYVGSTINTPVDTVKLGVAFDYLHLGDQANNGTIGSGDAYTLAGYASIRATEKLSFHLREEFLWWDIGTIENAAILAAGGIATEVLATTVTAQYDLWKNVISRLEFRWDHSCEGGDAYGGTTAGTPNRKNAYLLAANFIYQF